MCGLSAVVGPRLDAVALERLVTEITAALHHRGPDHQGCLRVDAVALGHTRLRVVDPSEAADQPMSSGGMHLVFSGAITNHRELRRALARDHGVVFRTTGDTEVLLHLLRAVGPEQALLRLKGMFAFVCYDAQRGRLVAARDRFGIKPLVWARRADGTLVLASEAQALLRHAGIDRGVDPIALAQVLRFNHPLGDRTFFQQVHALEPGCLLVVDGVRAGSTEPTVRRWAALRIAPEPLSLGEAAERLDACFRAAIARMVDVDVPHGGYLSGGVDSSGIAAELARHPTPPRLYSLVLPGVAFSEESAIDRFTRGAGLHTEKVAFTGVTLDDFTAYALRAEMPQWWTSDLALGLLARRARARGTKVVLSGEGPDELFAGYEIYRVARLRRVLAMGGRLAGGLPAAATGVARRLVPWLGLDASVATAYLASHDPRREEAIVDHFGFHPENLALWEVLDARRPLSPALAGHLAQSREIERTYFKQTIGPAVAHLTPLEKNLHFEITERLPRWILHMGDRMASTHGIELRFPYLDDDFVELALRLPMHLRATLLEDKRALRRMHRDRLPRDVAHRRKQPLYTPTAEALPAIFREPGFAGSGPAALWSKAAFERAGLFDFAVCDAARARLEAPAARGDALTRMADEWLISVALTGAVVARDLCGA